MGVRARSFAERLASLDVRIAYRTGNKLQATRRFSRWLWMQRPDLVYVFDLAAAGLLAGVIYRQAHPARLVVDTGDAITALAHSLGRGRVGLWLTEQLESLACRKADAVVVRGTNHRSLMREQGVERVTVIPDGVDTAQFRPLDASALRQRLGLDGSLVVGTLGSSVWNEQLQTCYGWELPDLLSQLRGRPVKALLIGGGDGVERVRQKAQELGVEDRMFCIGQVPYDALPEYLCAMDVALSKQTDDDVGQVRTTGKLPLYLACGRHVLATRVGEAAHVLPEVHLIDFVGADDPNYLPRLSCRVADLAERFEPLVPSGVAVGLAKQHFEYDLLASRVERVCLQELTS